MVGPLQLALYQNPLLGIDVTAENVCPEWAYDPLLGLDLKPSSQDVAEQREILRHSQARNKIPILVDP